MSKMYEALLRAEQEQRNGAVPPSTNGHGKPEAPRPAASANAVLVEAAEFHPPLLAPPHEPPMLASTSTPASFTPVETPWHPDASILAATQPRGQILEQIRVLRSRIHEIRAAEPPLKTLLISSGLPEEGKSFVTANLALSLASYRNTRVLLIDGDMRRGTMHLLLGTRNRPGLTDFLRNSASLSEIMQRRKPVPEAPGLESTVDAGLNAGLNHLCFIPCGDDADNAADLSGNSRFERLLHEVQDHFDWIIVDSSPVNLVADGVNMARVCDGVILVTRAGVTRYETAQRALHELKASRVVGAVMNASRDIAPSPGYYGYERK